MAKMGGVLMAVSCDRYQLPLAVFESRKEAAAWCGSNSAVEYDLLGKRKNGRYGHQRAYKFVLVQEEEDEQGGAEYIG